MSIKYGMAKFPENYAKAMGRDLPISTKQSIEICKYVQGMRLSRAKSILQDVILGKKAVPFTRHTFDLGHKKGIGPGRYPMKASESILRILNSVEANAQTKGLSANDLVILHIAANKAARPWRYGRQTRRKARRTHIEVVVSEKKAESKAEARGHARKGQGSTAGAKPAAGKEAKQ
ncbi:MAG: large subunit ribosomal protein L22 [archaeon GW2011_AR3]|nr:large subunit ribosomal protein L22 [uncultured archaeon]KHO46803.1 MAG: large subunit ribosomal protein L22 [archaeon GW2011_AR3]MBS3109340.1 50S ribosomal protein L22 [Candidatus Woesearchaeota archaeon]